MTPPPTFSKHAGPIGLGRRAGAVAAGDPSPVKRFDVVVATEQLSETADRDAALAVLWGCVADGGALALIEAGDRGARIAAARSALLGGFDGAERPVVIGPSPHDRATCDHAHVAWPQAVAIPRTGPPLRSTRKRTAGQVVARNARTVERFSYVALRRRRPGEKVFDATPCARVVATPLKRGGHVLLDVCTSSGESTRVTLTRARLNGDEGGEATYKDVRKATQGSLLRWKE